jgi:ABC-2 type transport system ATP-binding protein
MDVDSRVLGHLSKGYRQRVGLAEAMVHDPDILILDEPTAGLDPMQIREVRALIRELGDRHTILLSTHIMSEVEAVCGRVIMIVKGKVAVDDQLDHLQVQNAILLEVRGPAAPIRKAIESTPGVSRVDLTDHQGDLLRFEIQTKDGADLREALAQRVIQNGWGLRQLDHRRSSLEERFVRAVREATLAFDDQALKATTEIEAA